MRLHDAAGVDSLAVLAHVACDLLQVPAVALIARDAEAAEVVGAHGFALTSALQPAVLELGRGALVGEATHERLTHGELTSQALQAAWLSAVAVPGAGAFVVCAFVRTPSAPSADTGATLAKLAALGAALAHGLARARAAAEELQALFDHAPVGMIELTSAGTIVATNAVLDDFFGYPRGALLGAKVSQLVPEAVRARHEQHVQHYGQTPKRRIMGDARTFEGVRRDGSPVHVEVSLMPLRPDVVLAAVSDRSAQVREREVQQRLAQHERLITTGTLAAGVGHEINNPLSFVQSNLEFAIDELLEVFGGSPAGRAREIVTALREAREGAERIRRIVVGLRTLAREQGLVGVHTPNMVVESAITMSFHEIRTVAQVRRELNESPQVSVDEGKLTQVLVNLLVNAAQAFPTPNVDRNLIVVRTFTRGGAAVIEVQDNGPGIAEQIRGKIFDPFFTTKPVGVGTGLGLSISHSLVTAMGGSLTCASAIGAGTTFTVTLPPARAFPEPLHPEELAPHAARGRVLIIDDDPLLLASVARLIQRDHDVVLSADPRQARALLLAEGTSFDVVLCDVTMPHVDGQRLFLDVVASVPSLAPRFVFMTASTPRQDVREFLDRLDNDCLEKPVNARALRNLVRRAVNRSHRAP